MNRFRIRRASLLCAALSAALLLLSCSGHLGGGTVLNFKFNQTEPADYRQEKALYINRDEDRVLLNGTLKLNAEEAAVQVTDLRGGQVLWSDSYTGDANAAFAIELFELKAGTELELLVTVMQCRKLDLTLTSDNKLVRDREAPERRPVERPDQS